MRVVLLGAAGEVDVEVAVHDPAATVADLTAAVPGWAGSPTGLAVDGVARSGPTTLAEAGLRPGCEVRVVGAADGSPGSPRAGGR